MENLENVKENAKVIDIADDLSITSERSRLNELPQDTSEPVKYFKFYCNPFSDSVNPKFFFRTEAHEDAYTKMKKCVEDDISLGLTTAAAGTGKTLLTQILLSHLESKSYQVILILAYPQMSKTALLKEIINELEGGKDLPKNATVHNYLEIIQNEIISLYKKHRKLVVIIDEVHFLNADALHILRTLSNIETPEKKLITVLLFGEDIFLKRMQLPGYKSIFSRMFIRARLRPLLREEVEQYIKFRCLIAGGNPAIFSPDCYNFIYTYSRGIPRDINRLCHNALSLGTAKKVKIINQALLQESKEMM